MDHVQMFARTVDSINSSHSGLPMDVKMRSFVCAALNHRLLAQWFSLFCHYDQTLVHKYYQKSSYVASPASKLIEAQLRLVFVKIMQFYCIYSIFFYIF